MSDDLRNTCRHILTILAVDDIKRSAEFYRAAFDFKISVDVPVYTEFETEEGRRIGVYARAAFATNTGIVPNDVGEGELSGAEIYFHCDNPDAQIAKLLKAGATLLSPWQLRAWGDFAAYFRDPDGHTIVIARPDSPMLPSGD